MRRWDNLVDHYVNEYSARGLSKGSIESVRSDMTGCGDCGGIDVTGDGDISFDDLAEILDDWLREVYPGCGVCDLNGDRKINLSDFAVLASEWLSE